MLQSVSVFRPTYVLLHIWPSKVSKDDIPASEYSGYMLIHDLGMKLSNYHLHAAQ